MTTQKPIPQYQMNFEFTLPYSLPTQLNIAPPVAPFNLFNILIRE